MIGSSHDDHVYVLPIEETPVIRVSSGDVSERGGGLSEAVAVNIADRNDTARRILLEQPQQRAPAPAAADQACADGVVAAEGGTRHAPGPNEFAACLRHA